MSGEGRGYIESISYPTTPYNIHSILSRDFEKYNKQLIVKDKKDMKTFTQLFINILPMLFVAFGLFGVNEAAWGGTWYAKIDAAADPSNGGYVYVGTKSDCSASNATKSTDNGENSASKNWQSSGDVNLWLCAKAKSGYIFKGWNTDQSNTVLSGSTAIPYKVTVHGTAKVFGIGGESYNYYAIFARLAANTPAAGSTLTFDDTNVGEESGWKQIKIDHAHAGDVTISQSGNDGDFFVAATTSTSVELSSFSSTTETTRTLYVKFVPQNNGSRTCTLTVSSNNGLSSLTYYLEGTGYNQSSVTWLDGNGVELTSGETTLSAGDVLRASCTTGQTVSYSDFNSSYFTAGTDGEGNPILTVREDISGTINNLSVTANLAKNTSTYYAAYSEAFTLNVTNLTPQEIEWTDDIADLSNENMPYTITLSAVAKNAKTGAASGLPVTYSMASNASLSLSGNVLTVRALGGPVAITASVAGNESYAPASVTKFATVINMTDPCATSDSYNGKTLDKDNKSLVIYPTLPGKLTFNVVRSSSWFVLNKFTVKEYSSSNSLLATTEYNNSDISTSGETKTINCNANTTKIELYCDAYLSYSCMVSNVSTTRVTSSSVSLNSLSYATDPGQSLGKQVSVSYCNIPVFLSFKSDEDAGVSSGKSLWSLSTSHFGGCGKKGSQNVTVTFKSNAKGNYTDKLYVRNNVGSLLHTIDLSASVTAQEQFLDTWNIANTYNTTDQVSLAAATTVGNTDFTFTATTSNPANIVTITNAGVMTFTGSGTATIRAYQPGDALSQEFETTHNITINKVTPSIATEPSVAEIKYKGSFANNQLSDGLATVTLRGVENTPVAGTFTWKSLNGTTVDAAQGSHDYSVTFTPDNTGMYDCKTFTMPVTISRADGGIEMNDGSVKVKVAGINDNLDECKIDLDGLVKSKIEDGNRAGGISFAFKSNGTKSVENAEIDANNVFTATAVGTYTIVATQARTDYYEAASVEFTVTVNKLTPTIVFDNTENPEIIYSGDVIEKPAYRMYNGKEIDRVVSYVSSDPSNTGAIHVAGTTLTARDVQAPEGSAVTVTITASTVADALYNASEVTATHDYAVRAKRSTYFYLDGDIDATAKTLAIGGTAVITYNENVDENFTVGTEGEKAYITLVHDAVNRTITVTAQKGALAGEGVQTVTVNQPGDSRLWGRNKVYTFTVQKNVSALSLDGLTTTMNVEDTVATPFTGLANTSDDVHFSCSPEGSMKMENGKLIALAAGTNTVTFYQPATEYWTGISQSKTITVSKKDPGVTTELANRHAWYSIIEHPFKSLNTEKALSITSSNESLAKYVAAEDKIYVYGTSGNVTFTVNQDANYKYNAVKNYQKTFEIFQPNNRLPFTLTSGNLEDYNGGSKGGVSWNGNGVVVGSPDVWDKAMDWSAKYIILKFVGVPDKLSFDFENTVSIATQYGWHFYQSSNGKDWNLIKEYQDLLMNASGGTSSGSESNLQLDPATQYIKLEYHGNYGGRYKNVHVTERKEIAPKDATKDFGLGYNGNEPTMRTIKVDWYNVKPCTVTIINDAEGRFELAEGSETINSLLDNYGTAELVVRYKHDVNTATQHTATLHVEDADGNSADVTLTGQTTPAPQDIIWRSDLTPMPINGTFHDAAVAASNQPITLSSDHPEIVRVDENNTLVGVAAGTAHVTATAEGNSKWAETVSSIDIEVTTKNVQFITWNDNLSNRKREEGQTVEITLTATSTAGLPITYELDDDAQLFASISGNVLRLTGWGNGQVIAHQVGNEDYVAVQAEKSLVSRNPSSGCRPLVGEYKSEYTIWTLGEKEIELDGREPATIEFDAKCDASALWGLHVGEFYDGFYHEVAEISRLGDNNLTSSYKHFGPFELNRKTTKVRIYTTTGATMNRTFKNVEVTLAKYLELADNQLHFEQVDKGSTKTQSFYVNYSNLTGVLDVEMENESEQFEVVTETVGEDCGDEAKNVEVLIRFTGKTLGTEENAIIVSNKDQSLRVPVSAHVVLPSQTITWEPDVNVLTTDEVVLSATATSELPVSFTSGNNEIAEVVYEAGVYSLDIKSYGDVEITAHQAGNEDWSAATDKKLTYHISREVPVINTWPTAQVILPNTVGNATIIGGVKPEGIPGSFIWEDGSQTVTRQEHTFNVVFMPDNTNYYEPVEHALEIETLKTPQTITWNRADESEEGCSDVVILDATASSGLPITYHSSDSTKAYAVKDEVNNVMKLYILKGGDVTITAEQPGDETYAAAPAVAKKITLIRVLPTIETLPTATDMYVHHFLSNSHPQGGVVKAGENTVTGVFVWENGTELMDVPGTNQRTVVFQPYNSDFYQNVSTVIDVEVQRFAPTVIHSFTTEAKVYGTTLSEFVLSGSGKGYDYTDPAHYEIEGTFAWKDENQIPSVADAYATMVFHPTHTEWYDDVEIQVPITITKATIVSATATATMFYGQVLGDAVFTNTTTGIVNGTTGTVAGTITWDSSLDLMEYYVLGTYENLPIRFTPTDPNYESVEMAGTATLTVEAGFVFNGTNGATWNDNANWQGNEAPVNNNNEKVVILADVNIDTNVLVDAMTIKEGVTVTVKDGAVLTVGNSDSYIRTTYGNLHVENGGQVILGNGELKVNNFTLDAKLGNISKSAASGQVNGDEKLDVQGDAYFTLALDPDGAITYGWYDFVVPFEVDIVGGIYLPSNLNTPLTNGYDFAVMSYDEAKRAVNGKDWNKYSGTMEPGRVYTITVDYRHGWNELVFKKKKGASLTGDRSFTTSFSGLGEDVDNGWNGFGNGSLFHAELDVPSDALVQIYDHANKCYQAHPAKDYSIAVGTSFFMQVGSVQTITLDVADDNGGRFMAPARNQKMVEKFNLSLKNYDENMVYDHLWVGATEDATEAYVIGEDVLKMGTLNEANIARMWTTKGGHDLCAVNTTLNKDKANTPLSLYAPESGSYWLTIDEAPEDATLYLTKNGRAIWNLTMSACELDLAKGTTEGYGLRIVAREQTTTDIENVDSFNGEGIRKVMIDNVIYIVTPEGKMYDITGKSAKY